MLLLCWKQSGGREAKLIALFTFRDTSFSSNGPIRCESIWDHFFCMRRSFLFCLTHANTHAHLSLLPLSSNDTLPKFGSFFFFFHAAFERLRFLPVEDERYGRYHHHTHTEDNHDYVLRVDACKQHTQLEGFFFSSTFPDFQISRFPDLWSKDIKLNTKTLGHLFVESFLGAYLCILAHRPARPPHSRTGLVICQWW